MVDSGLPSSGEDFGEDGSDEASDEASDESAEELERELLESELAEEATAAARDVEAAAEPAAAARRRWSRPTPALGVGVGAVFGEVVQQAALAALGGANDGLELPVGVAGAELGDVTVALLGHERADLHHDATELLKSGL